MTKKSTKSKTTAAPVKKDAVGDPIKELINKSTGKIHPITPMVDDGNEPLAIQESVRAMIVSKYLCWGYSRGKIMVFVNSGGPDGKNEELFWKVNKKEFDGYIKQAEMILKTEIESSFYYNAGQSVMQWKQLLQTAIEKNDLTNAIKIKQIIGELHGEQEKMDKVNRKVIIDLQDIADEDLDDVLKSTKNKLKKYE